MNGYDEASKIDKQIGKLFKANPITPENAKEWWRLTRTVKSSLDIIESKAKDKISEKTQEIAREKSGNPNATYCSQGVIKGN